jgi:hypothetical protein
MSGGGSGAFVTVDGLASDDVARIEALLAEGQRVDVPLEDNTFIVDLPRAKLPARLVARDADERVIDVSDPLDDFGGGPAPAKARATSLLRVSGPDGSQAELLVGPSTDGGECMFIRHFIDRHHAGVTVSCKGPAWTGPPLQLGTIMQPQRFVEGRVRPDVATVRIRFADGSSTTLTPTRGYVLWAASQQQLAPERAAIAAEGLDARGKVVGRISLRPPRK